MNDFQAITVMVVLFALRCIVPIALMLAIGYSMNRLVAHWEREEQAGLRLSIPLKMAAERCPRGRSAIAKLPRWVLNNCDEQTRSACPAYTNPSLACWAARLRADGRLSAKCANCPLYTVTLA